MKNSLDEKEERKKTRQEEVRDAVQRRMTEGLNVALEQEYRFIRLTPSMGMGKTYTVARFMKETHDRDKDMRFFYFAPNISTRNAMKKELMDAGAGEDDILVVESEDDCLRKNSGRLESILAPVFKMKAVAGDREEKMKSRKKKLKDEDIKKYKKAQEKVENKKKEMMGKTDSDSLEDMADAEKRREDARKELLSSVKDIIRLSGGEKRMSGEDRRTLSALFPKLLIKDRTYILVTHKMIDFSANATGSDKFWQTFNKNDILIIDEADRIKETMWATQLDDTENPLDCYEMMRSISNKLNGDYEGNGKYSIDSSMYGENADEICGKMKSIADECLSWLNGGRPAANRRLEDEALSTLNIATFGRSTKVAGDELYVMRKDDRLSVTSEKTEINVRDMERRLTAGTRKLLYYIRKLSTALYESRRKIDVTYTHEYAIDNALTDVGLSDKTTREAVKNNIYKYGVKKKSDKELPMDNDDQYRTGCAVTLVSDRNRSVTSSSFKTFMFTSTPNYRIRCAVENARMTVFVSSTVMGRSVRNIDFGYLNRMFAWTGRSEYTVRYDDIDPYTDKDCTVKEINVQDEKKIRERIELLKNPEEKRKMRKRLELWTGKDHDKDNHRFFLISLISFIDAMRKNGNKAGLFFIPAFPKEKALKEKDPWWNDELIEGIISTYGDGIECKVARAKDLRERGREFHMSKDMLVVITTGQSAGVGENLTVKGGNDEQCDFDAVFVNRDSHVEAVVNGENATDMEITKQKKKVIAQWSDLAVLENLNQDCLGYAAKRISNPTRLYPKPTDSDPWDENPLLVQQAANAVQKIGRITRRVAGIGEEPVRKLVCYDSRLRTHCHVSTLMFPDTEFMGCARAFFEYVEKKENEGMPKEVAEAIDRIEEKNIRENDRFMKSLGKAREGRDATEYDGIRAKCWNLLDASEIGFCRGEYKDILFSTDGLTSLCFTQRGGRYTLREGYGSPLVQDGAPAARATFNMDAMNSAYGAATGLYLTDRRLAGDGSMLLPKYVEVAKGEIGERYFLELCRKNGIDLVPLPSDLKEEADFMVRGTDIYIDVKNHRWLTLDPHAVEKKISGTLVIANIFPRNDGRIFTPPAPIDGRNDLTMCIIHRFGSSDKRTAKNIEEAIDVLESVIISRNSKRKEEE